MSILEKQLAWQLLASVQNIRSVALWEIWLVEREKKVTILELTNMKHFRKKSFYFFSQYTFFIQYLSGEVIYTEGKGQNKRKR